MTTHIPLYPLAPKDFLLEKYVGKSLKDVESPAAVVDLSIAKKNCQKMLDAVKELGFGWRAHIKTHKTNELTQLQLGPTTNPANIIVSTLIEAEQIVPLLLTYPSHNLLYGLPIGPSSVLRLSGLSSSLGPNGLSLLVDHPSQLPFIRSIYASSSIKPLIFIKIDMGGHRAGVPPVSDVSTTLFQQVVIAHKEGYCVLHGLYSHAGHSYGSSSEAIAMDFLNQELTALISAASEITSLSQSSASASSIIQNLVLSVGATPSTTSIRNILKPFPKIDSKSQEEQEAIVAAKIQLSATIQNIVKQCHEIELHAGVYPLLDLQQLATSALPPSFLSSSDIGVTILSEVLSCYPERNSVLVGSGSLALGRDPCKAYNGFGILTPWNISTPIPSLESPTNVFESSKFQISYISQEHGIVSPVNPDDGIRGLDIGRKVRIWPNHACIASSGFGWYLVVDGDDTVVDVWVRFRGW